MPGLSATSPMPIYESLTITVEDDEPMAPSGCWSVPASQVCSYTLADDSPRPSVPLSEAAVRMGNSILTALVPESAILRDTIEDF